MVQNNTNELKIRQRVRIRFSKQDDLRLIGHRDLARGLERLFRRAGLRLGMSEGFHPKPRMSFPSALAVGIEGCDEVMELELAENWTPQALGLRLADFATPGIVFGSIEVCPQGTKKAQVRALTYEIPIDSRHHGELSGRIRLLMDSASCVVLRAKDQKPIDIRPRLESLSFSDGILSMRILVATEATPGPREVLAALKLPPDDGPRNGEPRNGEPCSGESRNGEYAAKNGLYPKRTIVELMS